MRHRIALRLAGAAVAAFALGELVSTGCGIITAPWSIPAAIAANDSPSLAGTIVDEHGEPLSNVKIDISVDHVIWEPLTGQAHVDDDSHRTANATFDIKPQRGAFMDLRFSKPGYVDRNINIAAHTMETRAGEGGSYSGPWPRAKSATVVLIRNDRVYPSLIRFDQSLTAPAPPGFRGIDLTKATNAMYVGPTAKPGLLTLEAAPAMRGPVYPDHLDPELAASATLRIADPDAGFLLVTPTFGQEPFSQLAQAPTTGYTPTLTLDRNRLHQLRAPNAPPPDKAVLFYFHVGNRYGKGMLTREWPKNESDPLTLNLRLALQPTPNNHDLATPEVEPREQP